MSWLRIIVFLSNGDDAISGYLGQYQGTIFKVWLIFKRISFSGLF